MTAMRVLVFGTAPLPAEHESIAFGGDLRDPAAVEHALSGIDALVLAVPQPQPDGDGWKAEFDLLDRATRGTYVALNAAVKAGVRRVVLLSTLALLERYPAHWVVDDSWRPVPDVERVDQLAAYLAEESAKELSRVEPLQVVCLRLGELDEATRRAAIGAALSATLKRHENHSTGKLDHGWWVRHAGHRAAREVPEVREATTPQTGSAPTRPIQNVVVFGAGGPLASAAQPLLAPHYR